MNAGKKRYIYAYHQFLIHMATIKQGSPLQGASGRLGNVVTYELNGVQVIRSLPYTKKRKPTDSQQKHRTSFKIQHRNAKSLKHSIIDRIWSRLAYQGGMNAYNRFIQVNRQAYGQSGTIEFPELMMLSQGELSQVHTFKAHREGNKVMFHWASGSETQHARNNDVLNIVLIQNRSSLDVIKTDVRREEGQATIPFAGNDTEIPMGYVFWSSANDQDFSPSIYWVCS